MTVSHMACYKFYFSLHCISFPLVIVAYVNLLNHFRNMEKGGLLNFHFPNLCFAEFIVFSIISKFPHSERTFKNIDIVLHLTELADF